MAMTAPMTILRSSLLHPSAAKDRWLYPAPGKPRGWNLALLQDNQGGVTVSETQNDGGGEQFIWNQQRGLVSIGDYTNPIAGGYPVVDDGPAGSGLEAYYQHLEGN
jgi:hypothetical protein